MTSPAFSFLPPGTGHEVDAFGRAAGEDDFIGAFGIDELGRADARGFIGVGRAVAQLMDAAVDIGVVEFVIMRQRLNHHARFLQGGGVVKINQRIAVNLLSSKNGKVRAQRQPINMFRVAH